MLGYWELVIYYSDGDNIIRKHRTLDDVVRTVDLYSKYERVEINFIKFDDPEHS